MESRKNIIDDLICKAVETQMQRTNVWIPRGKKQEGRNWEVRIYIYIYTYTHTQY